MRSAVRLLLTVRVTYAGVNDREFALAETEDAVTLRPGVLRSASARIRDGACSALLH
jgi:hypothetical protein